MYAISNWARRHIMMARLLITLLHFYLFGAAWWIAQQAGSSSPFRLVLVALSALILVWATASVKNKIQNKQQRFGVQKARFFVTGVGCLLLLIAFFSSNNAIRYHLYGPLNGAYTENAAKKERPDWNTYTDKKKYSEDLKAYYSGLSKKELRKELQQQLKQLREKNSATQVGAVIGVVFLTLIVLYVVAALACGLSCNGNNALALLVLIVSGGGVLTLAYFLIRRINRRKTPAPVKESNAASQPVAEAGNGAVTPVINSGRQYNPSQATTTP